VDDLTEAQRELFRALRRNPGVRVGEAATLLGLAPNTVSTLISNLSQSGWIERQVDPDDARSARLCLSPAAEATLSEWRDRRASALEQALAGLTEPERDHIERALPAISKLVATLQEAK